jgi:4-carboxymuconolactone decarboxylase
VPKDPVRIAPLPREEWTDEAREVFAFFGEPEAWANGSRTNTQMVFANHPKLAMAYNAFGKHLLIDSSLPVRPRELIVLRIAWLLKSEYEWHYHVGYGLTAGLTLDEIAAVRDGPDAPEWADRNADRAVLAAVDELWTQSRICDATWSELSCHYDRHQLMDLVFTIGQYVMLSWAISSFGIQLEDDVDRIGFDLKTPSGRRPGSTYRPGEVEDWTAQSGVDGTSSDAP